MKNKPIILKDFYEISASDIGYCIPIIDKDGNIEHYREASYEEYRAWRENYRRRTKL